jgi:YggT family protein
MNDSYLIQPLVFLIQVIFGFYALVVMLRLLFQLVRADFYNPLSQFIVKLTHPLLAPMRRVIPALGRLDTASLVLAWLVLSLEILLLILLIGLPVSPLMALLWALPALVELLLNIFLVAIIAQALMSWINPDPYNPAIRLLQSLTQPLLEPAQRLIPPIGGLDLSPMLVIVGIYLLKMLLMPPLRGLTGMPGIF